jgi:hypothetical protein
MPDPAQVLRETLHPQMVEIDTDDFRAECSASGYGHLRHTLADGRGVFVRIGENPDST